MATNTQFTSYILAADNHNLGNQGTSWLDLDTWTTKFGNAGKLAATSILSGANSFYNTGATVGNWLGADIEYNETSSWISAIDSDLGSYYKQNTEAADLGGFILGSLIPGLGGIKLFNAGQTALKAATQGMVGTNMGRALGLLIPNVDKYTKLASRDIANSVSSLKLLNTNTTKALGAGLWQNTLESAAFETVVQTTMFKSPVLEQQDGWDIASNIVLGGVLGGAISGAFTSAKIIGSLKKSRNIDDLGRMPFQSRPGFSQQTPAWEKITQLAYDSDMAAQPVRIFDGTGKLVENNFAVNQSLYNIKIRKNFSDIRESINSLTINDGELGNIVANITMPVKDEITQRLMTGYANNYFNQFSGASKILRVNEKWSKEIELEKAIKAGELVPNNKELQARYIELIGENVGNVTIAKPKLPTLGDLYKGKDEILNQVKKNKFSTTELWNPLKLSGSRGYLEAEARYIWAAQASTKMKPGMIIHEYDIPLLERAYFDKNLDIKIQPADGGALKIFTPKSKEELFNVIKESKLNVASFITEKFDRRLKLANGENTTEAAARIANIKHSYVEGTLTNSEIKDLFANQSNKEAYIKGLKDRGLTESLAEAIDPLYLPKYARIVYEVDEDLARINENVLDAIVYFKSKQRMYVDQAKNVVSKVIGSKAESLPDITDEALLRANRGGAGAGLFSFENSNYGTLGSSMAWIGAVTKQIEQDLRKEVGDSLQGVLAKVVSNPEAAIEFDSLNQKVLRSGKLWRLDEGEGFLYTVEKEGVEGQIIDISNSEVSDLIRSHINVSGQRTKNYKEIRAVQGHTNEKLDDIFRPIYPDLKQYAHFAFVKDPHVSGNGHTTMLHAASEKDLDALISKVPANYQVITKTEVEDFKKARGEYEFSRTLHENYIDHDLSSKGVFSNFFIKTDPNKIVDDVLQQHYRESDTMVKEVIRLRYEPQFNFLEDLGQTYSQVATSKFASRRELIEKTSDNPYFNYIKTALNISKAPENHLVYGFNKLLDEGFSKAVGAIKAAFTAVKTPEELDTINIALDKFGMKPAYYDAALNALVNHTAPRGELTKFVRNANSLLSLFTLGLDPLNALNNAVGSNILRMTELRHLTKAISSGNTEVAGDLGKLAKIKVPGTDDEMLAPTKLVNQAISNFWKDDGTLLKKYKESGYIVDRVEQLKLLVDDFTLKGTETVKELNDRINKGFAKAKELADTGERLSGNKLSEEFNRFISANVMDLITDIGVRNGILDPREAKAYINTFVNRVEGNTLAAQRPLIFQGPVGQAIGLFQSYQFNLLQQLFRYVSEGSKKDLAMLFGLQSTIYGLQSLPGFQFINTHLIGQLSGNKEHKDAYDAVYGITGRTAGDFFLYGIPSNLLQANIYSRGDINPRQITILPTNLQEIPIVSGWGKFLGSIKKTSQNIAGGGNVWESLLQGLEHNGISRPLAGFAQTLQGIPAGQVYSTSSEGSILHSNDLFAWASLVRMAGGRPLDEAITNDALFRTRVYEAARYADKRELASAVKTTLIKDEAASQEQLLNFAQKYAELGGKQGGFNRWMMSLYKNANVSQAEQLSANLNHPFSYKMQLLMGGSDGE